MMVKTLTQNRLASLRWLATASALIVAGVAVAVAPVVAAVLAVGAGVALLVPQRRAVSAFLVALFVLLAGYAVMGRGFAYIGVAPLFIGEMVLALGVLALAVGGRVRSLPAASLLLIGFIGWGLVRTLPYLGAYGFDALRDGAAWGYAAFALLAVAILRRRHVETAVSWYGRFAPVFVVWMPLLAIGWVAFHDRFPVVPGTDVQIPYFKPGDAAVHLAGVAAFILVGLNRTRSWRPLTEPLTWLLWMGAFAIVAAFSRGGMLSIIAALVAVLGCSVLFGLHRFDRWFVLLLTAVVLVTVLAATNVEFAPGTRRPVSVNQLVENLGSVVGQGDDPGLAGTRQWREEWWGKIIGYTFTGPYFWDGKGYGINLAESDGFLGLAFPGLRAPHNAHVQFLARGGVPALALWLAILASFVLSVLSSARRCAKRNRPHWVAVHIWILAYWLAAVVNMSFDVYLEGPQGGIPFWVLTGAGFALAAMTRADATRERHRSEWGRVGVSFGDPTSRWSVPSESPAHLSVAARDAWLTD